MLHNKDVGTAVEELAGAFMVVVAVMPGTDGVLISVVNMVDPVFVHFTFPALKQKDFSKLNEFKVS